SGPPGAPGSASAPPAKPLPRSAMNSRRLMGRTPRQRMMDEYSRSWSGFGGLHRNKKRKKKVWPALYGRAGLAKRRSVISITDAGEMPVYSHWQEKQRGTGMAGCFPVFGIGSNTI